MVKIAVGDMVGFQLGLLTVQAKVIGFTQDGQVVMVQEYRYQNPQTGVWEDIERTIYRGRKFIEQNNTPSRSLRHTKDGTVSSVAGDLKLLWRNHGRYR